MLRLVGGQIWCYLKERYRNVVPHYSCRWLSSTLELRTDNTKLDLEQFSRDVVAGKTYALARAITLAESRKLEHSQLAAELLDRCIALRGSTKETFRVGISGSPGVGKSTFIESLGCHITRDLNKKVAVLAVDPSSIIRGGSILGDKTRMNKLATEPNAYVRPSPSGGTWGGLARHTDEVITLCETAGYEVILVETVGVGQSEAAVADAVDMLILLVSPGAGDELQGSKKGILELADIVVVNRADGSTKLMAAKTRQEYLSAIELQQPRLSFWKTPVLLCSCIEKKMEPNAAQEMSSEDHWSTSSPILSPVDIWKEATQFHQLITQNGVLTAERGKQRSRWMWSVIRESIVPRMKRQTSIQKELPNLEQQLAKGAISPRKAALNLLDIIFQSYSSSSKN
ncbi:LAO/AO transport system kinase isoform 1 [Galdieria sulphuraria]|uniref:LAO/AO transport system kinase isoform 1 n=1 Tax=Galdieria sulphuraria TaxID=130081 RepID=M2Y3M5_GALSU|nr:LAO/AO transport system kinase isoform 1 [Galdieria sulphuraria]EME30414.1 LAO/AO transport system kinase isoform 1 [Galdieria sulphuraria]|eukprot:XP_005706934.1 LAO/AO transport system kinase isoform 1 [Galdieria sulphuraria]